MVDKKYLIISNIFLICILIVFFIYYENTQSNKSKINITGTVDKIKDGHVYIKTNDGKDYQAIYNKDDLKIGDKITALITEDNNYKEESLIHEVIREVDKNDIINHQKDNNTIDKTNIPIYNETAKENDIIINDYTNSNQKYNTDNDTQNTETYVVNYFNNIESEINNSNELTNKIKESFISVVDFLFYNKDIKGHTFSNLSEETKLKIINISIKIDTLLEKKFPNYKKIIGEKSTDFKNNAIELYINTTTKICSKNKQICNEAINIFQDIKKHTKISWEIIKKFSSFSASKIKVWYEIYSGKIND